MNRQNLNEKPDCKARTETPGRVSRAADRGPLTSGKGMPTTETGIKAIYRGSLPSLEGTRKKTVADRCEILEKNNSTRTAHDCQLIVLPASGRV